MNGDSRNVCYTAHYACHTATVTVATPYSHSNTFEIDLNSHKSADLVLKIRNIVPMGYVEI